MLRWHEEFLCDYNNWEVNWNIITDVFTEHVHCRGKTYYREHPDGIEVELQGEFSISLDHIPGIPSVIVRKAVQILEPMIVKLITPNLKEFFEAAKEKLKADAMR
ncbi:MAG: hypothetical protein HQM12_20565 [SAR324 cluster bacterium]|nr:hypothetical protein [SAR324 cluster bacterium]